ncbi:MAG: hypothetical protein JO061_09570, partial [Acidobacteriaceae bacterium]|nr:hypothetical protein [Acidobacteriaceae bacterium]
GTDWGSADVAGAIDAASLRNVLESLPGGLQNVLGEGGALLSGGEGQRVRLARAIVRGELPVAVLDEPFRGLDREKRRELLVRVRRLWRNSTLLCVTHDIDETRLFDRVVVIEAGRIAEQGDPQELAEDPNSRYAQLLAAELHARSGLWSGRTWRRIRVQSGKTVEALRDSSHDREAEVA